jgi:UDP-glucose 4-epimerase
MSKTVLVTGGTGFIGSHIVDKHISEGDRVIILDKTIHPEYELHKDVTVYQGNMCDLDKLKQILEKHKPDVIHHCAGHTQLRAAIASPTKDAQDNIFSTLSLIETVLFLKEKEMYLPQVVVFSSSASIYGGYTTPPFLENQPPLPVTPYGVAKTASEQYLRWFSEHSGIPVTIFRYANVYGPRQSTSGQAGVVAKFMSTLVEGKQIVVYGSGKNQRDYVYVADIARAHYIASKEQQSGTFNLGTGKPTTTNELAELCRNIGKSKKLIQHKALEQEEQSSSALDVTQVLQTLGWKAEVPLEEGLVTTLEWYQRVQHYV